MASKREKREMHIRHQKDYVQRLKGEGKQRISFFLKKAVIERLDGLKLEGEDRAATVTRLVKAARKGDQSREP